MPGSIAKMTIACYAYDHKGVLRVFQTRTFPRRVSIDEVFDIFDTMNVTAKMFGWIAPRCQEVR